MLLSRLPRLNLNRTAFFLCDIQEKLVPTILDSAKILHVAERMLKVSEILDIPVIVTEQYPKGLGPTFSQLNIRNHPTNCSIFDKTQFSMFTPEVKDKLQTLQTESIVIFGMETHVCVYQTVKDLLDEKFNVFLASDGISSRFLEDRSVALEQMRNWGAVVSTSESIMFELLRDSKHEKFKAMSELIKSRKH